MLPTPGSFATLDLGYATYVAMARQDHRYNNPVTIVFTDLLSQILFAHRRREARRKARRNLRLLVQLVKAQGSVDGALEKMMQLGQLALTGGQYHCATAMCQLEDQLRLGTVTKQMVEDAASVYAALAAKPTAVLSKIQKMPMFRPKEVSKAASKAASHVLTRTTAAASGVITQARNSFTNTAAVASDALTNTSAAATGAILRACGDNGEHVMGASASCPAGELSPAQDALAAARKSVESAAISAAVAAMDLAAQANANPSFGLGGCIQEAAYADQVEKFVRVYHARRRLRVKLQLMLFLHANPSMILFRRNETRATFQGSKAKAKGVVSDSDASEPLSKSAMGNGHGANSPDELGLRTPSSSSRSSYAAFAIGQSAGKGEQTRARRGAQRMARARETEPQATDAVAASAADVEIDVPDTDTPAAEHLAAADIEVVAPDEVRESAVEVDAWLAPSK